MRTIASIRVQCPLPSRRAYWRILSKLAQCICPPCPRTLEVQVCTPIASLRCRDETAALEGFPLDVLLEISEEEAVKYENVWDHIRSVLPVEGDPGLAPSLLQVPSHAKTAAVLQVWTLDSLANLTTGRCTPKVRVPGRSASGDAPALVLKLDGVGDPPSPHNRFLSFPSQWTPPAFGSFEPQKTSGRAGSSRCAAGVHAVTGRITDFSCDCEKGRLRLCQSTQTRHCKLACCDCVVRQRWPKSSASSSRVAGQVS